MDYIRDWVAASRAMAKAGRVSALKAHQCIEQRQHFILRIRTVIDGYERSRHEKEFRTEIHESLYDERARLAYEVDQLEREAEICIQEGSELCHDRNAAWAEIEALIQQSIYFRKEADRLRARIRQIECLILAPPRYNAQTDHNCRLVAHFPMPG